MVLIVVKYGYFQIVSHVEVNADTYTWDLVCYNFSQWKCHHDMCSYKSLMIAHCFSLFVKFLLVHSN